jgi:Protein of unknown function (DUF1302)
MRRAAFLIPLLLAGAPSIAHAQEEEEVIDDPMLRPTPTPTPTRTPTPTPTPRPKPPAQQLWRLSVFSRGGTQTSWDDLPGGPKDVVEWRTRAILSAGDKPSERLKWEVGVRFDALARAQNHGDPAFTFEARPWEAYLDVAPVDRLRLKVGNQILSWGRLDVGSAADVLGAYDLREGPAIDLDALRIPTPTATATWFPVDAFQLDVAYTPFFTPHRFDVAGTNYAIVGPNAPAAVAAAFRTIRGQLDPSSYASLTADFARINAPDARPDNGELGTRATWRSGPYDLALTYGFVRSKIPSLALAPDLAALLANPGDLTSAARVNAKIQNGEHLLAATYDRYHQIALDLEGTAGQFTVAGEVGVSPERTLFVRDPDTGLPSAVRTPVAQAGLKATYAKEETFAISAEASVLTATQGSGATYFILGPHRRLGIAFVALHDELGRHVLDAAALATTSGPSLSLIPRYGYKLTDAFVAGAGAAFYAGPRGDDGSLAAAQRGTDQVFVYVDLRL